MDVSAPHLGFVLGAWGLSVAVIVALVAYVVWRDRTLARRVKALEDQGLGRRSRP
jgi:heme exporter protein CcmD